MFFIVDYVLNISDKTPKRTPPTDKDPRGEPLGPCNPQKLPRDPQGSRDALGIPGDPPGTPGAPRERLGLRKTFSARFVPRGQMTLSGGARGHGGKLGEWFFQ